MSDCTSPPDPKSKSGENAFYKLYIEVDNAVQIALANPSTLDIPQRAE